MKRPSRRRSQGHTGAASRRISVFTEGEKTEPSYLVHWHRAHRDKVYVAIERGLGVPTKVVDRAIEQKRKETREAKRGQGRASDEYWCVFDIDQHPNIDTAVERAQSNSINVAVSNPCIELWFILHFNDQTAYIDRGSAQSTSRQLIKCDKVLNERALRELVERFPDAKDRAVALDHKHFGDGRAERSNPSSGMWRLIEKIVDEPR